jgi:hypothetical protein
MMYQGDFDGQPNNVDLGIMRMQNLGSQQQTVNGLLPQVTMPTTDHGQGQAAVAPSRKRPSEESEAVKARKKKWKESGNTHRGRIEFYYKTDEEKRELFSKIGSIKKLLGAGNVTASSTFSMLKQVMDYYIINNLPEEGIEATNRKESYDAKTPVYQYVSLDNCDEELFMCTTSAVENLLKRVSEHKDQCTGTFSIADSLCFQHVATHKFHCSAGHDMDWASSPHVEGGDFLANLRMAHGYLSSGMLPNQYERFCKSAGIGVLGDKYLNGIQTTYSKTIQDLATKSMNDAVNEEIAHSECIRKDSDDHGISVMCDARHCWRKNAQLECLFG